MRGLSYNTDENGDLRIERSRQLHQYQKAGYTVVFVDESHWSVGNVRKRIWGEKGKTFPNSTPHLFSLSCVCEISDAGEKHCRLFNRTINGEIFEAYITELMNLFSIKNTNVVFVMDNAPIHKEELVRLANENNHTILFNAPYSPECNTIEMVF